MARLILSNLCLSFNILLLNTVLRKTPSTLISSRDLIKLVCSVSGIAKPFEPYFVCLLRVALKYCVCESALGSHAFILKVLRAPFKYVLSAFSKTLVCTNVATVIVPCTGFPCVHAAYSEHGSGRGKLHFSHSQCTDSHGAPVS